ARSLSGMPPEVVDDGGDRTAVSFRRPLLGLRRSQTEAVCRELGLDFLVDPSNAADGPWRAADGSALRRAAVRERVLPVLQDALGPGVVPALARTADQLRRDEDYLRTAALDLLETALHHEPSAPSASSAPSAPSAPSASSGTLSLDPGSGNEREGAARRGRGSGTEREGAARRGRGSGTEREGAARWGDVAAGGPGVLSLDVAVLGGAHPAVRTRALHLAARRAGSPSGDLKSTHVGALDALVVGYHGQGPAHLPGGLRGTRSCGRLVLSRYR
ncbi:TilS substrate-binding domain-containing protein, partial [Georgenia sp. 10Sc9-8]|nr:TilS substrate-binding domain-containing protein [Georgenia halotolerans]